MKYCFDIDGIICTKVDGNDYSKAEPNFDVIDAINWLFCKGHDITLYTARGQVSGKNWKAFTYNQLRTWGVRFDRLIMDKPAADFYIDDKIISIKDVKKYVTRRRQDIIRHRKER